MPNHGVTSSAGASPSHGFLGSWAKYESSGLEANATELYTEPSNAKCLTFSTASEFEWPVQLCWSG